MYRGQSTRHMGGFTLVELMIVLVIAAVLLAIAAPGFRTLLERNRLQSASSNLFASLMLARSEALKRNQPVWVCKGATSCETSGTDGDWDVGWIVHMDPNYPSTFDPNNIIATRQPLKSGDTLRVYDVSAGNYSNTIDFRPDGSASAETRFILCNSDADAATAREVRIGLTGRARLLSPGDTCAP